MGTAKQTCEPLQPPSSTGGQRQHKLPVALTQKHLGLACGFKNIHGSVVLVLSGKRTGLLHPRGLSIVSNGAGSVGGDDGCTQANRGNGGKDQVLHRNSPSSRAECPALLERYMDLCRPDVNNGS